MKNLGKHTLKLIIFCQNSVMVYKNWERLLAKTLAILQQNNASSACLGLLGQGNSNRIIYIFILLPKVPKAGKAIFVIDIYASLCHHCFHEFFVKIL
jgi:hypothetical protein